MARIGREGKATRCSWVLWRVVLMMHACHSDNFSVGLDGRSLCLSMDWYRTRPYPH